MGSHGDGDGVSRSLESVLLQNPAQAHTDTLPMNEIILAEQFRRPNIREMSFRSRSKT